MLFEYREPHENPEESKTEDIVSEESDNISSETSEKEVISEVADTGISRLRVQISKLRNKMETDPKNVKYNAQLSSLLSRKKNLEAEARIRDVWAQNAEALRKTED